MNHAAHPIKQAAIDAIAAFNADPNRPFDEVGGQKVYYRARLPILATDCDYEIVSISGVQGRRLPA
mgnify:CR=1 FL=1